MREDERVPTDNPAPWWLPWACALAATIVCLSCTGAAAQVFTGWLAGQ